MPARFVALAFGVALFAACGTNTGPGPPGGTRPDGYVEDHVDPGPSEITAALADAYDALGGATWRGWTVPITRGGAPWVYVERRDGPARSRQVYVLDFEGPSRYVASLFDVAAGVPFSEAGEPPPVAHKDLVRRDGCAIVFARTGPGSYVGTPEGEACGAATGVTLGDRLTVPVWGEPGGPSAYERL